MDKILAALDLWLAYQKEAGRVSALILGARAENRDLTAEELASVAQDDDAGRTHLVEALARAKEQGR